MELVKRAAPGAGVGMQSYGFADFFANLFNDIFGGGGSTHIPRELLHSAHPS